MPPLMRSLALEFDGKVGFGMAQAAVHMMRAVNGRSFEAHTPRMVHCSCMDMSPTAKSVIQVAEALDGQAADKVYP